MLIYSINQYLQQDASMLSISGKSPLVFNPLIGYDEDVSPIVLYQYSPNISNGEMYYIHYDTVWYTILDTNADRAFKLRNRMIEMLNLADRIQNQNIDNTYGRLLHMTIARSVEKAPTQPEGYYQFSSLFEFCWIPNS